MNFIRSLARSASLGAAMSPREERRGAGFGSSAQRVKPWNSTRRKQLQRADLEPEHERGLWRRDIVMLKT